MKNYVKSVKVEHYVDGSHYYEYEVEFLKPIPEIMNDKFSHHLAYINWIDAEDELDAWRKGNEFFRQKLNEKRQHRKQEREGWKTNLTKSS